MSIRARPIHFNFKCIQNVYKPISNVENACKCKTTINLYHNCHDIEHTMNTQRRNTWAWANHFILFSEHLVWYVFANDFIIRMNFENSPWYTCIRGNTQIELSCRIACEFGEFRIVIMEDLWFCLWHCINRRFRVSQANISQSKSIWLS